jgi:transforming growth factor-beta-induced protein
MAVALVVGSVACGDSEKPAPEPNIVEVARAAGDFTVLVGALEATGLDETLSGDGPFTVFAPTDNAFALLPEGLIASLSTEQLTALLTYHVVAGAVDAATVVTLTEATSVEGSPIFIQVENGTVVLDGRVQVIVTDIPASNGIIHVVDAVLVPGNEFPSTIVGTLAASPRFADLVDAVVAGELDEALSSDNGGLGFTLFAPTNDAFEALGPVDLTLEQLQAVLLYHAASGEVPADVIVTLSSVETLEGSDVSIEVEGNAVILNGSARVEWVNLQTTNGIIHVISEVLIP